MKKNTEKEKNTDKEQTQESEQPEKTASTPETPAAPETAQEITALTEKYIRLAAEFENARKRWDRDRADTIKFANFTLLQDIMPVLDTLEHAIRISKEHSDNEQMAKGIEMTHSNLLNIVKKRGVSEIEAEKKIFNPHVHEIVGTREHAGEEHQVLEVVQKGYLFEDKVLRTAKVIISIAPVPDPEPEKNELEDQVGEA